MSEVEKVARDALAEARIQLAYLDERWPTGTTPPTIAKIDHAIAALDLAPEEIQHDGSTADYHQIGNAHLLLNPQVATFTPAELQRETPDERQAALLAFMKGQGIHLSGPEAASVIDAIESGEWRR